MQVHGLVLKSIQKEVVVYRVETGELVEQTRLFFHFLFLPDRSGLFLAVQVV